MTDDFTLHVHGVQYAGWTGLNVDRSLDQLAHSYTVQLTDKWSDTDEIIPVRSGDTCKMKYGKKLVTTGYIDDDDSSYSATSRSLSFSGRSKTGDLVDCSAKRENGRRQWRKVGLLTVAEELCGQYGISVSVSSAADLGATFREYTIEDGETVFDCLARGARRRGVLMLTDENGNLVFDRAGTRTLKTVLEFGQNIIYGGRRRSTRELYSEYTVICQTKGNDNNFGSAVNLKRTSEDERVNRHRPLVIVADNEDSGSELQKRADWERNARAGRSVVYSYKVRGWEHEDGLWRPNDMVRVIDPRHWLDAKLLISSTSQSRDNSGTFTNITLKAKEAYDVQPLPPATRKKSSVLSELGI